MVREEALARGEDAAIIANKVTNDRRDDAVMHVAGDKEIKFREIILDFRIF